jgi:hypothetical protein
MPSTGGHLHAGIENQSDLGVTHHVTFTPDYVGPANGERWQAGGRMSTSSIACKKEPP